MEEIWFFFKTIEALLGVICMIFHIMGFLDYEQPLPHQMYFCGTFFGFTMIAIFGNISISLGSRPSILSEAIVGGVASVMFIICSICAMYHAERDFHLMYLSDHEESMHPFFAINKKQSIASLFCGVFYMLHTIYAIDALTITTYSFRPSLSESISETDLECYQPIKMYICGKTIHDYLQNKKWFQKLVGQELRNLRDHHGLIIEPKKLKPVVKDANII